MCGRFTLTGTEELAERFSIMQDMMPENLEVSYNIAPGRPILSVIHDGEKRRMGHLRWGLVPGWAKDEKIGYKMINARAETLAEKPSFKKPFQKQRCLIVADGFYEWKKDAEGHKQPYRITVRGGKPFAFAGLWEKWQPAGDNAEPLFTCTIITTEANDLMADIHDRMPVILTPEDEEMWLDCSVADTAKLSPLLHPYPSGEMDAYPVSTDVNSPKHNRPELIEKVDSAS